MFWSRCASRWQVRIKEDTVIVYVNDACDFELQAVLRITIIIIVLMMMMIIIIVNLFLFYFFFPVARCLKANGVRFRRRLRQELGPGRVFEVDLMLQSRQSNQQAFKAASRQSG